MVDEREQDVSEVSLVPTDRYADGSPVYGFHTSFPTRGVRALPETHATKLAAQAAGLDHVSRYERDNWPGGMGQFIGVVASGGRWAPVVNTYYSNS